MFNKVKCAVSLLVIILFISIENVSAVPSLVDFQVESNYPPFKFVNNGYLTGFDIELANLIFDSKDYSVMYSYDSWDKVYENVKQGRIDTCGLLSVNEERKKDILYSAPVLTTHFSLYTRKSFEQISLDKLQNYKIAVVKGYYTEKLLKENLKVSNYSTYKNFDECIQALRDGSAEVVFANQEVLNYLLIRNGLSGEIMPQLTELYSVDFAYGVRKGNEKLLDYMNKRIADIKKSGAYEIIYQKYFFTHSQHYLKMQNQRNLIIGISVLALVFIVFVLLQLYIRLLKKRISSVNEQLHKEHEWLSVTLSSIGEAVIATDENGIINYANDTAQLMTGYREEEMAGKRISEIMNIYTPEGKEKSVEELLTGDKACKSMENLKLISGEGDASWISINSSAIRNKDGNNIGTVMVLRNVTEHKKAQERINHLAYYDTLTNLPNRAMFLEKLNSSVEKMQRNNSSGILIFLDIDNFKTVNDGLGHEAGDTLLKMISKILVESLEDTDFIARLGGDEFIIMKEKVSTIEHASEIAEKLLGSLRQYWTIGDREFYITSSMGITFYPKDGKDEQVLLKNADTAMYKAKELGKNNFRIFDENMNADIMERIETENNLRHALKNEEFTVYYQPQVDIKSGTIIGAEALIRWVHPLKGIVSPSKFIPLAEESGLIVQIGELVLSSACRQWKDWIQAGHEPISVAVNLSGRQFRQEDLLETVESIINETGMNPRYLELEITESMAMYDMNYSIGVLKRFKDMGIRISLDDFGTGFSSLNYLRHLPIDNLKIDKSFIDNITYKSSENAIAKAMISMAHSMELEVIAEGVETNEQLEFLHAQGCDTVQGYLFSRPLENSEFERLLKEKKTFHVKG